MGWVGAKRKKGLSQGKKVSGKYPKNHRPPIRRSWIAIIV